MFPHDTKRRMREIAIHDSCNTQIVHILRDKRDGKLLFKGTFISILTKPVELTHKWIKTNFKY